MGGGVNVQRNERQNRKTKIMEWEMIPPCFVLGFALLQCERYASFVLSCDRVQSACTPLLGRGLHAQNCVRKPMSWSPVSGYHLRSFRLADEVKSSSATDPDLARPRVPNPLPGESIVHIHCAAK